MSAALSRVSFAATIPPTALCSGRYLVFRIALVFASIFNVAKLVSPTTLSLGGFAINLLWTPFSAAFSAVLFHDLRLAKEGVEESRFARVLQ